MTAPIQATRSSTPGATGSAASQRWPRGPVRSRTPESPGTLRASLPARVLVAEYTAAIARRAGHMLTRAKLSSAPAIDAFVVATAAALSAARARCSIDGLAHAPHLRRWSSVAHTERKDSPWALSGGWTLTA